MSRFCRTTSVLSWTRRLAAIIAAAIAVTAAGVLPADASVSDDTPPVVLSKWISHQSIDVIDGPVLVTVRLEIQDGGGSGLAPGSPWLAPVANANYNSRVIPGKTLELISGDRFHGTYETTFTFPEHILSGSWQFMQRIVDARGNAFMPVEADAIDSIGFYLNVTSIADKTSPAVSATFSPEIVDITDGPAKVKVAVNAEDSGIGIASDATAEIGPILNGTSVPNSSTDPKVGIFTRTFEYSKYSPDSDSRGSKSLWINALSDANGNSLSHDFVGSYIVATRPLRAKAPGLHASEGTITASWAVRNEDLKILEYETEFTGPNQVRTVSTAVFEGGVFTKPSVPEASLTGMPAGTYTARVRARNQLGWGEWTSPSKPVEYILTPMTSSTPAVSGTAKVGQTLTADPGTWTPGASLAYRWLAGGVRVSGATGSTLVLGPSQSGKAIAVRVTGSKPDHETVSRTSGPTGAVAAGALTGATTAIKGTARVGSTLTARPGNWSPAPVTLSYQWYRSGVAIVGGTAPTYKLTAADLGRKITVRTTARKSGYKAAGGASRATAPVTTNVLTAARPVIPRTAALGQTLTARTGIWSPADARLTYQWNRNGAAIPGATARSYKVVSADRGSVLSIRVTGRKSGYKAAGGTSRATSPVAG